MTNVQKFIQLQDKANQDIDMHGETTSEVADELEKVGDQLTPDEQDAVIAHYIEVRGINEQAEQHRANTFYEQGLRHY